MKEEIKNLKVQKKKTTESKNPKVTKTKKGKKTPILSKCVASDSKKSRFVKEQEPTGLLSSLGIKHFQAIFL